MRGRAPWGVLAILFVVVPLVEIYLLIQVGQVIGAWWTILLLIAVSVLGSYLIKREGLRAWQALRSAVATHRMPARELADGGLILVGGTLLLTPGFLSDALGLFFILPFTRPLARRALTRFVTRKLIGQPLAQTPRPSARRGSAARSHGAESPSAQAPQRPGPNSVVQGEVVD